MVGTRTSAKPKESATTTTKTKANTTGKRSIKSVAAPVAKDTTITRQKRAAAAHPPSPADMDESEEGPDDDDEEDEVQTQSNKKRTAAAKKALATTQNKLMSTADNKPQTPTKKPKKADMIPMGEQGERFVFVRDYLEMSRAAEADGIEEVHIMRQVVSSAPFHRGKSFIVPRGYPLSLASPKGDFLAFVGNNGYRRLFHIKNKMDSTQFQAAINEVIGDFAAAGNPVFFVIPNKPGMSKTIVKKEMEAAPVGSDAIFIEHADEMNVCGIAFFMWNKLMTGPYYDLMNRLENTSEALYNVYRQVAENPDLFPSDDAFAAARDWCQRVLKKKGVSTRVKGIVPKK